MVSGLQLFAGPADPHLARRDRKLEDRGQFFVVVALGILEDQHGPVFLVERFQHVHQVQGQARRGPCRAGCRGFPLAFGRDVFVPLPAAAAPPHRQAGPHGDGVDPGGVFRAAGEAAAVQEQSQENLLGGVAGVLLVAQQPEADPPDPLPKAIDQGDEGRAVGAFPGGLGGQFLIGAIEQGRRPWDGGPTILVAGWQLRCQNRRNRHRSRARALVPGSGGAHKADLPQEPAQVETAVISGRAICVFWRKWGLWLKTRRASSIEP